MTVAVVGAGISGLSLAYALARRGQTVRVLEAADRVGGAMHTTARNGFLTEAGPNGYLDREPATRELVASLGLQPRLAAPSVRRRFLFTRGALRELPVNPPAFLKSDVVPWSTKLRLALEPLSRRGRHGDESLATFARRHLGQGALDALVDPMQSGIYAGDPEQLSLRATFPALAELERRHRSLLLGVLAKKERPASSELCSFDGGLSTLAEALASKVDVSLKTRVAAIIPTAQGWSLQVERGGVVQEEKVETLVLATPSYAAAELLEPVAPQLSRELAAIAYAKIAAVHVAYPLSALSRPLEGFGFLVPHVEGRAVLGVIYISSVFPWRAPPDQFLFTCMVGGARRPELVDSPELLSLVREELKRALGLTAEPSFHAINRWQRGIPQYNVGHLERVARVRSLAQKLPPLQLIGNAYDGVGINDCIRATRALAETWGRHE
ncbi:MAG: protoporphyrinogen oxidase [Myxococcaceae bacterium]